MTVDLWSSGGYMSILELQRTLLLTLKCILTLAFEWASHPHTAKNVKIKMLQVLNDNGITFDIVKAITCDGASNNKFNEKILFEMQDEPIFTQQDAEQISIVEEICDQSSSFINHFSRSGKRREQGTNLCIN